MRSSARSIGIFVTVAVFVVSSCSALRNSKAVKLNQLLLAGNEALIQKRYDEALRLYDEGLKIAPREVMFLSNKSIALRSRGAETYNSSRRIVGREENRVGIEKGKKDIENAAIFSGQAWSSVRNSLSYELIDFFTPQDVRLFVARNHAETLLLVAQHVDKTRTGEAVAVLDEYIGFESDAEKKLKSRLNRNKLLLENGQGEAALEGYRKLLAEDPNQLEAILGVGLALSQSGLKEEFDEARTYLKRFIELAPDDHPMKADIVRTLEYMK